MFDGMFDNVFDDIGQRRQKTTNSYANYMPIYTNWFTIFDNAAALNYEESYLSLEDFARNMPN